MKIHRNDLDKRIEPLTDEDGYVELDGLIPEKDNRIAELEAEYDQECEIRKALQRAFGVEPGDFHIGDAKDAESLVRDALNVGLLDSGYKTREEWGEPLGGTVVGVIFDLRDVLKKFVDAVGNIDGDDFSHRSEDEDLVEILIKAGTIREARKALKKGGE